MKKITIRKKIHNLLTQYNTESQTNTQFIPGKSKVRYSGAYYNHQELIAMTDAMLDGWFGLGRKGELLESKLSDYIGCQSTLLTNSGSSASLLAMASLKSVLYADRVELNAEVITPACTFATTVAAIVQQGFVPVFVDVDLGTYNMNPKAVEKAITKKTRIIFIPHTLGNPNDMRAIMRIAIKYNLHIVEDNCDGLGSEYDGKKTGSFGVLATCSFYPAHHITTAGEGGAVFVNDPRLHRVVLSFRNWGRGCWCTSLEKNPNGACGNRFNFKIDGVPIDHKYYFLELGYNLKPVELQAAMGLIQLKKFPKMAARRRKNFAQLYSFFKKYENFFVLPKSVPKANPCWFSFPLTIRDDSPFDRLDITRFLEKNLIETRTMFAGNIVRQPAMRRVDYKIVGSLKNSDTILKSTFFIGTAPHIGKPELTYMQAMFTKYLKRF